MGTHSDNTVDDRVVFAREDQLPDGDKSASKKDLWKVLVVDDEEDVHEITRITLKGYSFDDRGLSIFSAYTEDQVKKMLAQESDIALILLDVVMEEDDTGLRLVDYIRNRLKNQAVRIVLRTGQPGKAPEQDVITRYDINDYKTKPELTAQKLYTSVTACLRAYKNLMEIESNNQSLEAIINSTGSIFKNQPFTKFGEKVLSELEKILMQDKNGKLDSAFIMQMPDSDMRVVAGTGDCRSMIGSPIAHAMPQNMQDQIEMLTAEGGECFTDGGYAAISKTKEGFTSGLYLDKCSHLTDSQRKMLRIYASTIAIGFENISLNREIINTQKEVILTLGEIVETRSQETANHVTRVAEICHLLAREYGMDEKTCEMVRLATPMHDVGKIAVPEAILNKPGRLTKGEFEVIKQHPRTGYEILNKSSRPIMKTAAIAALEHHEKWDGTGYPQGLAGEDIHIFGRITAVADVFDALSHTRCYKEAWSTDQILALFEKESGHHFDPKLVEIFFAHIDEIEGIRRRFPE